MSDQKISQRNSHSQHRPNGSASSIEGFTRNPSIPRSGEAEASLDNHAPPTGRLRSLYSGEVMPNGQPAVDEQEMLLLKTESTKTMMAKAEGKGTLAYFRSREAQLGVLSMVLLVFQGTALSLVLRYSRTRPGTPYLPSVAVIYTELIKLIICVLAQGSVCWRTAGDRGLSMREEISHQAKETFGKSFPMVVPAGLFVMQQILVIVAASHLDAVTFQICSQSFKILPTAIFAVWLLGQYLTPMQWASLPVLAFGVVFVTLNGSTASASSDSAKDMMLLGLSASALSGLSSAYAGVYFEKYVKGKLGQTLWIRNLQLGIYGFPLAVAYSLLKDQRAISTDGFHQGFDALAWGVVALQVFGGLIVGMVVKYADNILKNFANALSVILTVMGAMPLFGQYPSGWFIVGVSLVSLSVFMYGKSAPQLFSAFDLCGGCRKLTVSYACDDDATGCLPLYSSKRRVSDGRITSRRCSNTAVVRITLISVAAVVLFVIIVFLGHPSTKVLLNRGMHHANSLFRSQKDEAALVRGAEILANP